MSKRKLVIGSTQISDNSPCFVIAEIGHNHQGDLAKCKEMFKAAKECGVDSVKLQKRDNRTLFAPELYSKPYDNENSFGDTYGEHREALEFGESEYRELIQLAKELDLIFFATAFDIPSADFLAALDMPAYKIASGDLKSTPLLKYVAAIGKPIIMSTGGASLEDVKQAYHTIMPINPQLCILQCTASYPTEVEKLELNVIKTFRDQFPDCVIGLSDHYNGIVMAPVAFMLGARVIEKHFTMNHTWKGTDHAYSLEPTGMRKMVRDLQRIPLALGTGEKRVYEQEKKPIEKMSKKLVVSVSMKKGDILTAESITIMSPGDGLSPIHFDEIIGKRLLADIEQFGALSLENIG